VEVIFDGVARHSPMINKWASKQGFQFATTGLWGVSGRSPGYRANQALRHMACERIELEVENSR